MNENIVNAICIAVVLINAVWAYALWQINIANKRNKKVGTATAEVLANRIADLNTKVEGLQYEVDHIKLNQYGWKWTETSPDNTIEPKNE